LLVPTTATANIPPPHAALVYEDENDDDDVGKLIIISIFIRFHQSRRIDLLVPTTTTATATTATATATANIPPPHAALVYDDENDDDVGKLIN